MKMLNRKELAEELIYFIQVKHGECPEEILDRLKEKLLTYLEI